MNSMLIIVDGRSPISTFENLSYYGQVHKFSSQGITYEAISGHPDIFIFSDGDLLILAPNCPQNTIQTLRNLDINFQFGNTPIDSSLKNSTPYNILCTSSHYIHKKGFTDKFVCKIINHKTFINVPQSYTRCSCIALSDHHFITSDKGIENILRGLKFDVFFFPPDKIRLPPYPNGFIGGCCGIWENKLFFNGNPILHEKGEELLYFIESIGYEIIILHDNFLYDGGGIIFLNS